MEILVTIVAFWLILVGAYGAYSITRERRQEGSTPRPRVAPKAAVAADASGPFAPVTLPKETVPSFISRSAAPVDRHPRPATEARQEEPLYEEAPDRFRAEKIIAARVAEAQRARAVYAAPAVHVLRDEEPSYDEPRYHEPHYEAPQREEDREVSFLRAQLQHLRSEINALSSGKYRRTERPKQRRYRTGNYTHLPRTLRRQVNEVRGFRRFFRG